MKKQFKALVILIAAWRINFGLFMIDKDGRIGVCDFGGQRHWHVYYPDLDDYVKDECSGRDINRPVVYCSIKNVSSARFFKDLVIKAVKHLRENNSKIMAEALA